MNLSKTTKTVLTTAIAATISIAAIDRDAPQIAKIDQIPRIADRIAIDRINTIASIKNIDNPIARQIAKDTIKIA